MTCFEKPHGSRNESRSQPARSNFRIFLRGQLSFGAHFLRNSKTQETNVATCPLVPTSGFSFGAKFHSGDNFWEAVTFQKRTSPPARSFQLAGFPPGKHNFRWQCLRNGTVPETTVAPSPLFPPRWLSFETKVHSYYIFENPQGSRNESRSQPALSHVRVFFREQISFGAHFLRNRKTPETKVVTSPLVSTFGFSFGSKFPPGHIFFEKPQQSRNESRYQPARTHLRGFIRDQISVG